MSIGSKFEITKKQELLSTIFPTFIHGSNDKKKSCKPRFILLFALGFLLLTGPNSGYQTGYCSDDTEIDSGLYNLFGGEIPKLTPRRKNPDLRPKPCDFSYIDRKYNPIFELRLKEFCQAIMQNLPKFRNLYQKRLKEIPSLRGRITIKLKIVETGNVISCELVESKLNDPEFESAVISEIKLFNFQKIDVPIDTTEVSYPMLFSQ